MAAKPVPKKGKKMPKWAIPVGILGVVAIWYFFIRGKSSGPAQGGDPFPTSTPAQDAASSGQPSVVSAPSDSLAPGILDSLGVSLQQTGLLGSVLGDVAMGAQSQLGSIASTAVGSSFEFGSSALQSQASVLSTVFPTAGLGSGGGGDGGGGGGGSVGSSPAPAKAAAKAPAFGGVVSAKVNSKTGVKTTTYANGRVVTQAPGKTAYVSKKGS